MLYGICAACVMLLIESMSAIIASFEDQAQSRINTIDLKMGVGYSMNAASI